MIENTSPVTCRRPGCGRRLTSPASIARGMSRACAIKEALRLALVPYSPAQRAKAEELIISKRIKPARDRDGMYLATASDKVTKYWCSALSCPCRSPGPCYHMAGAAIFDAYRAVA